LLLLLADVETCFNAYPQLETLEPWVLLLLLQPWGKKGMMVLMVVHFCRLSHFIPNCRRSKEGMVVLVAVFEGAAVGPS